jgi:hypothetical protein
MSREPVYVPKHRALEYLNASDRTYEALRNSPFDEWEWMPGHMTESFQMQDHMGVGWALIRTRETEGPWKKWILADFLKQYGVGN